MLNEGAKQIDMSEGWMDEEGYSSGTGDYLEAGWDERGYEGGQ